MEEVPNLLEAMAEQMHDLGNTKMTGSKGEYNAAAVTRNHEAPRSYEMDDRIVSESLE